MPTVELAVPGRLCLFGEHSDWAGELRAQDATLAPGACLIAGTDQRLVARATAADRFELRSRLPDGGSRGPFVLSLGAAPQFAAALDSFFSYAAATAAIVWQHHRCSGIDLEIVENDLPISRGLSSSAAICVLTARAFNRVHQLGLDLRGEMELAYRGELAAGSLCGRMDQGCAYGRQPVLLRFDGDRFEIEPLQAAKPLHLLIVDLAHRKDTRRILADLRRAVLAADPDSELRSALGGENLEIVDQARRAIESGDAPTLGALMRRAQDLFDAWVAPHSPDELRAPRLHSVLRLPAAADLTWGGKGVGSQGDGCAQFVCRGVSERQELTRQIHAARLGHCLPLTIGSD